MEYTKALANLIDEFKKFPGIGPRSAQRMAFYFLKKSVEQMEQYVRVMKDAKENIKYCENCFNLTTRSVCEICSDFRRDSNTICVVEEVKDLVAIERTGEFKGLYHVLGGVISPLDGISPKDLNIDSLMLRIKNKLSDNLSNGFFLELVLAVGLSTEGEATILYLKRLIDSMTEQLFKGDLKQRNSIRITRLAYGLPVGADLDYADETTLAKALHGRILC